MRVGLVGCGRWGANILRDLLALGCDVPVVARSEASIGRARAGGASEIVSSVAELGAVDGVVVATPTSVHPETVLEALALGVPVFVEKPLCSDPQAAPKLAEAGSGRLFVMDKWRYHPGVRKLAELARTQALGAVRTLKTVRVGWGNPHDEDCVWILVPHELAIALEIFGRPLTPVAAVAQIEHGKPLSMTGLTSDDGVAHVLEVSARSPLRARRVELHCAGGVAVLNDGWDEHVSVFRSRDDGREPQEERIATPGELPLLAELRAFVEHLRGGPAPISSADEGALVVAAIARLRELAGVP
jgi:predicted dehydrogenase